MQYQDNKKGQGKVSMIGVCELDKGEYCLNRICFGTPGEADFYVGMEKTTDMTSKFVKGQICSYEVTHPGHKGKVDWIKATGVIDEKGEVKPLGSGLREYNLVVQNAWFHATTLFPNDTIDQLKEKAHQIADAILQTSKDLSIKHG